VLAAATSEDVGDAALPLRRARTIHIAGAPVSAARISYAGELGWELTTDAARAVGVWDALRSAGRDFGLEPLGYRALDSLRMEKGYRYFGVDMTMLETPDEAGLGAFVSADKAGFTGREALLRRRARAAEAGAIRLRTIVIGDTDAYLPVYGGEAVRSDGDVVGRLRSVAYGATVTRTVGYVYLPSGSEEGARLVVDVFDERMPAVVAADVLVDPRGERMRG
jgi:glycine cleavage system aminomethyltransferase T